MKTAAAYIRVSTEEQAEYSPESQLKAIQAYAGQHDMIVPDEYIFIDEGISGRTTARRQQFNTMIAVAKTKPKPFDAILLWKFSRFARNRQDSIVYKSMLRKQCGIDVISVTEQLSDDNTSVLIEALIEAMDEYYSLNLAEEVRRGMQEKFSRGEVISQPPFGYRIKDGVFVPDEENAQVVQMIYEDYLSGAGTRQIAMKLNSMGLTSQKGNNFENRTVEYILTNPVYIGKLRRSINGRKNNDRFHEDTENTIYADGKHEPLISQEMFEEVQRKRTENKKLYRRYERQAPVEYMLKGLVRCSNCGATLTLNKRNNSLQCCNYAKGACKVSHAIVLNKLNRYVTESIKNDLESGHFEIVPEAENQNFAGYSASSLIERERKKLERVRQAYEAGIDTLEEYKLNKERLTAHIHELEKTLKKKRLTQSDKEKIVTERAKQTLDMLETAESSETAKNLVLRTLIDRIIFVKPKGLIEVFYKV